jgi:hypothetical protein
MGTSFKFTARDVGGRRRRGGRAGLAASIASLLESGQTIVITSPLEHSA